MSSGDTINPRAQYREEVPDDGYTADDNDKAFSDGGEDYDSSSDSDGGLLMQRRRSTAKQASPSDNTNDNASLSALRGVKQRRGTGLSSRSKKSSRSGSSNTMTKVRSRDSQDERRRPSMEEVDEP